jgi:putative ABC transport system ATP-binding protein
LDYGALKDSIRGANNLLVSNLAYIDTSTPIESRKPLIHLQGVRKTYKTAGGECLALGGIDVKVYPGELIGILGKSGAGKTTLINLITATDHLTSGEIWVGNVPVHRLNENQAATWRGSNVGVVYQSFHLIPSLSLIQNIMLAMDFNGNYSPLRSKTVAFDLLRDLELEEHAHKLPGHISGGQQQRVAIARALANKPPILVADEPTGRLDSATADLIFRIFEKLAKRGHTILMVSHDPSFYQRYSRVLWIADGVLTDTPQFPVD